MLTGDEGKLHKLHDVVLAAETICSLLGSEPSEKSFVINSGSTDETRLATGPKLSLYDPILRYPLSQFGKLLSVLA